MRGLTKYKFAITLVFIVAICCSCNAKIELPPYIITQDDINNIHLFKMYTYNDGKLYYTKSRNEHSALRFYITDIHSNRTVPTGLNLGSQCYIWGDYILAENMNRDKGSLLGLVDKDNFTIKPLIKENAFSSDTVRITHYQPYKKSIIIKTNETVFNVNEEDPYGEELLIHNENLYNYNTTYKKTKKISSDYQISQFWIYKDIFFFIGNKEQEGDLNLYAIKFHDIDKLDNLNNSELLVENVEPKILFCNEYLIFSIKNKNQETLIYKMPISKGDKTLLVKDNHIKLENVNGDWIYYNNFDENIIYRVHISSNNIESFYVTKEFSNLSIQSTLGKNGFICTDNDNIYHITLDKKLRKIE